MMQLVPGCSTKKDRSLVFRRHNLISKIPTLTYLDDRPVFPDEHEVVQAWASGGLDGERLAREQIAERKKQRELRNYEFMQAIRAEAFREVCNSGHAVHDKR